MGAFIAPAGAAIGGAFNSDGIFGKAFGGIGSEIDKGFNGVKGNNAPIIGKGQGQKDYENYQAAGQHPAINDLMNRVNSGQLSMSDAIKNASATFGGDSALTQAFMNRVATDPSTAGAFAENRLMSDSVNQKTYGAGGTQDRELARYGDLANERNKLQGYADADREALSGRGEEYGLQKSDLEAYGQASGNIAKMFGAQGNSLAQSLADRGLGSAANGIAAQSFSNLAGNQNEQLANSQMQIANNRIQSAMGLAKARSQANLERLGMTQQSQGQNSANLNDLSKNWAGMRSNEMDFNQNSSDQTDNRYQTGANAAQSQQALDQNVANAAWAQQQESRQPGMFEAGRNAWVGGNAKSIGDVNGAWGNISTMGMGGLGGGFSQAGNGGKDKGKGNK